MKKMALYLFDKKFYATLVAYLIIGLIAIQLSTTSDTSTDDSTTLDDSTTTTSDAATTISDSTTSIGDSTTTTTDYSSTTTTMSTLTSTTTTRSTTSFVPRPRPTFSIFRPTTTATSVSSTFGTTVWYEAVWRYITTHPLVALACAISILSAYRLVGVSSAYLIMQLFKQPPRNPKISRKIFFFFVETFNFSFHLINFNFFSSIQQQNSNTLKSHRL